MIWAHLICYPTYFNPTFQLTFYKFIVLGLLDLSPFTDWAKDPNLVLTYTKWNFGFKKLSENRLFMDIQNPKKET